MKNEFSLQYSGDKVFNDSLGDLPLSQVREILEPIGINGPVSLAIIYNWNVDPEPIDPRS